MNKMTRVLILSIAVVCLLALTRAAVAQEANIPSPTVTVSAADSRARFVAASNVVRMKIEILSAAGEPVFEASVKGNVFDWAMQDGSGQSLGEGQFLCVVTLKTLAAKLSQRIAALSVEGGKPAFAPGQPKLTTAQEVAVGPIDPNSSITVVSKREINSAAILTHNGAEGQLTATTGDLTLRTGDILTGKDTERVRITTDGRIGIGTDKPEAALDVAGIIRAPEFNFTTGTRLISAEDGSLRVTRADGSASPLAAGTGTMNRLAKWAETGGSGTLTDAAGYEGDGLTFFGTNFSGQPAPLFNGSSAYHTVEIGATGTRSPLTLAGGSGVMEFWKDLGSGSANPFAAVSFGMAKPGTPATNDMVFSTYLNGSWNERMRVTSGGSVGIGTATPNSGFEIRGTGFQSQQRISDTVSGNSLVMQAGFAPNLKIAGYNFTTGSPIPLYISPDGANTVINRNGGSVGIGLDVPSAFYKLDVAGPVQSRSATSTHFVVDTNGPTNSWARFYMRTSNFDGSLHRSWFMGTSRDFFGDQLYIADETANKTRMVIDTSGRVGIGTVTPQAGLELSGTGFATQQRITDTASGNSLVLQGGALSSTKITGYNYGTGQAVPLHLSVDGANTVVNENGGNVLQPGAGYGIPKAMIFVLADGTISRCYNGYTGVSMTGGSSTTGCGFSSAFSNNTGDYSVGLGFDSRTRFMSVTTFGGNANKGAFISPTNDPGLISVTAFLSDQAYYENVASDFFLIVY